MWCSSTARIQAASCAPRDALAWRQHSAAQRHRHSCSSCSHFVQVQTVKGNLACSLDTRQRGKQTPQDQQSCWRQPWHGAHNAKLTAADSTSTEQACSARLQALHSSRKQRAGFGRPQPAHALADHRIAADRQAPVHSNNAHALHQCGGVLAPQQTHTKTEHLQAPFNDIKHNFTAQVMRTATLQMHTIGAGVL